MDQDKRSEYKTISFENLKIENGRSINMSLDIKKRSDQALNLLYLYFITLSGYIFYSISSNYINYLVFCLFVCIVLFVFLLVIYLTE